MRVKAKNRPMTVRRFAAQLRQHLNDTRLLSDIVYPAFLPEEEARAKYAANAIQNQLAQAQPGEAGEGPLKTMSVAARAARHRLLTTLYMYQLEIAGTLNQLAALERGYAPATTKTAPTLAEELDAQARVQVPEGYEGYNFETKEVLDVQPSQ